MKELTIEQKAKAYDEAIKRGLDYIRHTPATEMVTRQDIFEAIFPEFKESEDEKIRKLLIGGMKNLNYSAETFASIPIKDVIAWLEKQGESYTKKDVDDAYFKGISDAKNESEKQYEANYQIRKDIATFIFNYRGDIKDRAEWMNYLGIKVSLVEKQGEQKPYGQRDECMDCQFSYAGECKGYCAMKRGEQNPTNRVEPKFKVGDWCIDNEDGTIFQIVKVLDNTYIYKTNEGKEYSCTHYSLENDARLWTIQDAKDGDVLTTYTGRPFIFKGCLDERHPNSPVAYCGVNYDNCFFVSSGISWWTDENVHPATKEQRDLLFSKMKETGYEWDTEKKELKKIEQKPTQETKPFKVEHGKYYYCIKDYFCGGKKQASKGDVVQALRGLPIMGLKDASEYFLPVNLIKEIW